MGVGELFFCTAVFAIGVYRMKITIETPRTPGLRRHRGRQHVRRLARQGPSSRTRRSISTRTCLRMTRRTANGWTATMASTG